MGSAAERRTQAGLAGGAITHFQKARGQICARQGIVRTMRQRMPVGIGGGGIFALQQQNASERCQYFGATRRSIASFRKDRARLAAVVMVEVQASEVQLQINGFRCQCKTAFDDADGLVEASDLGELAGQFLEGRQKWWAPRRGPAQLFNRFRIASGAAQRRPKQGFDSGIAIAPRCLFEGLDRLPSTVQSEQGLSQYRYGSGVGPAPSQDFSGELFCLSELPRSQREGGAFEQLCAVSAANVWGKRRLRHGAYNWMALTIAITAASERPETLA